VRARRRSSGGVSSGRGHGIVKTGRAEEALAESLILLGLKPQSRAAVGLVEEAMRSVPARVGVEHHEAARKLWATVIGAARQAALGHDVADARRIYMYPKGTLSDSAVRSLCLQAGAWVCRWKANGRADAAAIRDAIERVCADRLTTLVSGRVRR